MMDAEYLQEVVGPCLALALSEVSAVRPADPIEYLAAWLIKYRANLRERGLIKDEVETEEVN